MKKLKNGNSKWCFLDGKSLIPKKIIEKIDYLRQNWGKNGKGNMQKIGGSQNWGTKYAKNRQKIFKKIASVKFISQGN